MGPCVMRLRRQAEVRCLAGLAAVCAVLAVALVACAGGGDESGSEVGAGLNLGSSAGDGSASEVGSETESPPTLDEGRAEDGQQLEDGGLPGEEHPSEDAQQARDGTQPEDEPRATDETQAGDGQGATDETQAGDGQGATGEAQPEDGAQPEHEQPVEGEGQAKAEKEQRTKDEQRVEGEGQADAEKEQPVKDELLEGEDSVFGSGENGVVEQTARMVEESGGEVVYVLHPGRGDRTVLGLPVEFVDGETPLIVSLHGYAGDSVYHSTYLPLHERLNAGGFGLLLPNALPDGAGHPAWNPTDRCCDGSKAGEDDIAYLTDLVAAATSSRNFGPVYFFGYSNGGFMAYHMACKALAGLRAVASLAGTSYLEDSSCGGAPPVSVLHIHGTADNVILYGGDQTEPDSDGERVFYASAEDMVTRWSRRAGCDWPEQAQPHARLDLDQSVPGPETQVFRPEAGCATGISIELWAGVDSGHGPGYGDAFMDALLDWLLSQA